MFGIFLVLAVGLTVSLLLLARTNSAFRSLAAKKQEADAARNALAWELDRSRGYQLAHESLNASRNDPALVDPKSGEYVVESKITTVRGTVIGVEFDEL